MKKWISLLLVIAVAAVMLAACGENTQKLDRIDVGSVKTATVDTEKNTKEPKFTIEKRAGLTELVDLYNRTEYTVTDNVTAESLLSLQKDFYTFRFYDFDGKLVGECTMFPDGYLMLPGDTETVYLMKEGFDQESVDATLKEYNVKNRPAIN